MCFREKDQTKLTLIKYFLKSSSMVNRVFLQCLWHLPLLPMQLGCLGSLDSGRCHKLGVQCPHRFKHVLSALQADKFKHLHPGTFSFIEYCHSITCTDFKPVSPHKHCLWTPIPDVEEGFIGILGITVRTFLQQFIFSQFLKHGFDSCQYIFGQSPFVSPFQDQQQDSSFHTSNCLFFCGAILPKLHFALRQHYPGGHELHHHSALWLTLLLFGLVFSHHQFL